MPTIDYQEHLIEDLKDLDYAAGYLTAALEEGEDVFLLAVRDVAQAHGGMGALAHTTQLNRENLYAMLSAQGNPRLSSITTILDQLGFAVRFTPKGHSLEAV
jgi:probable addiction module antidote protein